MRKFVKIYEEFTNEAINAESLREYADILQEELEKYSPEQQLEMMKDLVHEMKVIRPDLVEATYRVANVSQKNYNSNSREWENQITGRVAEVGFKPLRLQVGASGHAIYGSFYSETDRKTVLESILNTANSIAVGNQYNFQLIQGKVRDYYRFVPLVFLAIATGVDIEKALSEKFSINALRGALGARKMGII